MYEWTDEQKLTLFDEPKLKENSEYPDWLWTEDFLTDLSKVDINDLDPSTKIYWQKVRKFNRKKSLKFNILFFLYQIYHLLIDNF